MTTAGKLTLGVLAGFGVLFLIAGIACVTGGCGG
jgi:hypothetical protein